MNETHAELAWENIWLAVTAQLDKYRDAGLEQPLTEDVVRFAIIEQFAAAGVDRAGWKRRGGFAAYPTLLTSSCRSLSWPIEFEYPREPRETNAAWTQHLGEALKDFYRLADMPAGFVHRACSCCQYECCAISTGR